MFTRQLILGLVLAFGAIYAPSALAKEQSQLHLKSLQSGSKTAVNTNKNVSTVAMIYQPGCQWCKKQGKLLANIQRQCGAQVNIALIGADANKQKLKRELRHFDNNLPAYQASKSFLRNIKGVAAFPTTVIFDVNGKLVAKKRGYITPEKLAQVINTITHQGCDSTI